MSPATAGNPSPVVAGMGEAGGTPVAGAPAAGSGGMGPAAGSGEPPSAEPMVVNGCGETKIYKAPDDPSQFGPWAVGVRTVKIPITGGTLTAEVWYPAAFGSEQGKSNEAYDLRVWLPKGEAMKIPETANKLAVTEAYRDLPIDAAHGPYPAVLFAHGLGSFRIANASMMTSWASRGLIVVAADHPGDFLTDYLISFSLGSCPASGNPAADRVRDIDATLAALRSGAADFAFLGSSLDKTRLGLSGHSQGGGAVAGLSSRDAVQIILTLAPLGGGAVSASPTLKSVINVTGMDDNVTTYSAAKSGYNSSPKPKRIVGITGAGHIDVTDLCKERNNMGKVGLDVALEYGVCGASVLAPLAQCGAASATQDSPLITNYATTAALEETLLCQDRKAAFANLKTKYPLVGEFLESL